MDVLPMNFKIFQLFGLWSESNRFSSPVTTTRPCFPSRPTNCTTLRVRFLTPRPILSRRLRLAEHVDRCSAKRLGGINGPKEEAQRSLGSCVEHHVLIRNGVGKIETLFGGVIGILFATSLITLCTTVYQISKQDMPSVQFFALQLYLACMLFQTFFYCFYGNELQSKSRSIGDTVYKSDWIKFSPKEKKSLKLIILMSQRELNVSCNGIFILSLSTFMWIIKTSYSAFNLLQQIAN
ncbi:odorant receptor 22b-like [Cephus cinctus]|uniref:Odorant receptor 22b-like n=1 Tax=Cephus cinctus TaxID=211228 RepID=A0AAJ7CHE9_CEPCN|nr:odorant receptor 22b-like [Cephus cinctus]